jgi:hypothetical protein
MPRKKAANANGATVTSPPTDWTTTAPVPTTSVIAETTQEKANTKKIISRVCRLVKEDGTEISLWTSLGATMFVGTNEIKSAMQSNSSPNSDVKLCWKLVAIKMTKQWLFWVFNTIRMFQDFPGRKWQTQGRDVVVFPLDYSTYSEGH